jgi:hypothetical protein
VVPGCPGVVPARFADPGVVDPGVVVPGAVAPGVDCVPGTVGVRCAWGVCCPLGAPEGWPSGATVATGETGPAVAGAADGAGCTGAIVAGAAEGVGIGVVCAMAAGAGDVVCASAGALVANDVTKMLALSARAVELGRDIAAPT